MGRRPGEAPPLRSPLFTLKSISFFLFFFFKKKLWNLKNIFIYLFCLRWVLVTTRRIFSCSMQTS